MKKIIVLICLIAAVVIVCPFSVYAGGTLSGKVNFVGTAPAPKPVNFGPEKQCAIAHGDKPPMDETIVVNSNNTLKDALVYVKEGATGQFEAPKTQVLIDQNGCIFTPHVSVAMVGQEVVFKNSDTLLHNVRTVSTVNKVFNIAQPIQNMTTKKTFASPEIGIQLKCDVHFWMLAYLHVVNNPYYAVTGEDGSFTIQDLPAGTYTVEVWHGKLGAQTQSITIAEGESKSADFSLEKRD